MKVICEYCKEEVFVNMYFYDVQILTHENEIGRKYYEALAWGKTICPSCGGEIRKLFNKEIDANDIIDLARN